VHLGPIQAHRPQLEHPHRLGVAEHLNEDCLDLLQEALAETVDRVVIRMRVPRDIAKRDRVIARPFQGPAGEGAGRVPVEQQRQEHRRVVRIATPTGIALLEPRDVELLDHVDNEPSQVIFRQPLLYTRRKQKLRVAVHGNKTRHRLTHQRTSMQLSVVKIWQFESPTDS
jgi:hypothetical protein